ncbi:IPT/TIG domain-containing protein [Pseudogemmatithrix spongiicola]|uniref:IPT/TIG domain-containing protein n=1 Tax=Pseudogemmatithrix spongiicola TaxID=3062599 RepID=A0AA49K0X8_9BACT|nr:IPT/TIG domain-containing protein [Gemmatimonadaceae bacterium 'strain 138']WKW15576.1 IPT/TIG domain-containing protein [Gemmatimonadaceae bacterium 'strain 318']
MRLSPAIRLGRVPLVGSAIVMIALSLGCAPDRPLPPFGVRQVAILLDADTMRPGQQRLARAVATGFGGEIVDAPVVWRSLTPTTLAVSAAGQLLALAPGVGVVRAAVGSVVRDREIQLVNPPAVAFIVEPESLALRLPGPSVVPSVIPLDVFGEPIIGAALRWSSDAPRIATVSPTGSVTPVAVGASTLRVELDAVSRDLMVRVDAAGGASAPSIDSVVPSTIVTGAPFTVYGTRLTAGGLSSGLAVDGFAAQVLTSASTQITALVPSTAAACVPSGEAAVQVSTADGIGAHPVRIALAPRRTPALGSAVLLLSAAEAACVELPASGRYLVNVLHAARAVGAGSIALSVDHRSGREAPSTLQFASGPVPSSGQHAHLALLERNRAFAAHDGAPEAPRVGVRASLQLPPLGGFAAVRVPDLDDPRLCVGFRAIGARTVYDGTRIAILEDTTSLIGDRPSLAGQMDAAIAALGSEIDLTIWPLIERFGNPLVMDDRLDANGKVVVVLTPTLNAMRGGAIMGAVVSCDFFPRAAAPASNVGEMLYLQVPDVRAHPDPVEALRVWRAAVRGTIAHELKHVVGFAERIARGQLLEESWLEEATARHAEELYTRALTGLTSTSDAAYASIRCEARAALGDGSCQDTPVLMRPALAGLYRFLDARGARSPLGSVASGDDSYYGSGWSLLRFAMDHAAIDEASFTRALSVNGQSGIANLEARSGRSWDELLARWSLAVVTDGRAAGAAVEPTLRLKGWALGDLFEGFCGDLGACGGSGGVNDVFGRADPVRRTALAGNVTVDLAELAPGGFATFELAPSTAGSTRLLRLRGLGGAPLPSTARVALLRVE